MDDIMEYINTTNIKNQYYLKKPKKLNFLVLKRCEIQIFPKEFPLQPMKKKILTFSLITF